MRLLEAITACMVDLEHYASTHGPGPDRRLADLKAALAAATTYPLGDRVRPEELAALGCMRAGTMSPITYSNTGERVEIRAVTTDEYRRPEAGDWYLSGAEPAAYRAFADLGTSYRIMRLVPCRKPDSNWEVLQ